MITGNPSQMVLRFSTKCLIWLGQFELLKLKLQKHMKTFVSKQIEMSLIFKLKN